MTVLNRLFWKIRRHLLPLLNDVTEWDNRKRCICAESVRLYPSCQINNGLAPDRIRIGTASHVRGELNLFPNGERICVGQHCYIGDNTRIWAMTSIVIGDRVLISHGVNIHDNNSHSLSAADRHRHYLDIIERGHPSELPNVAAAPILIEDDAWIGFNATVLKGVRIGKGAIVGANAMITKDVLPFSIVVGSPSRVVGEARP